MDTTDTLILIFFLTLLIGVVLLFLLPVRIGRRRGISENHMQTIKLLVFLGIFFGITWIVALILACVYPPATQLERQNAYPPQQKHFGGAATALDTCANCGQSVGRLETPKIWKGHTVCTACYKKLA